MGACPGQIPISCVPLALMVTATMVRACRYIMVVCLGPYPWYQFLGWSRPVSNNFTETPANSTEGRKRCPLFILLLNSSFMERCFM